MEEYFSAHFKGFSRLGFSCTHPGSFRADDGTCETRLFLFLTRSIVAEVLPGPHRDLRGLEFDYLETPGR